MQAFYTSIIIVFLKGLRFQDSIAVLNPWIEALPGHSYISQQVAIYTRVFFDSILLVTSPPLMCHFEGFWNVDDDKISTPL